MRKTKSVSGTEEWSVKNVNYCIGCENNCVYCYGKRMAGRFNKVKAEHWEEQELKLVEVRKRRRKKYEGMVMVPSAHDITPEYINESIAVLEKLLKVGNRVLVVSKPRIECISQICSRLGDYRNQILFRFTIGAKDDRILSLLEPNAPSYGERLESLRYAFENRFQTSVSVEPMLDSENIDGLIADLRPYVTDAIWIGKLNGVGKKAIDKAPAEAQVALRNIKRGQVDWKISCIYERYRGDHKIKWKGSIKKLVGIPLAEAPGLDT